MTGFTAIAGNTHLIRDRLFAMGGKWSPENCCWFIPNEVAQEALTLILAQGERPPHPLCRTPKRYGIIQIESANGPTSSPRRKSASLADPRGGRNG